MYYDTLKRSSVLIDRFAIQAIVIRLVGSRVSQLPPALCHVEQEFSMLGQGDLSRNTDALRREAQIVASFIHHAWFAGFCRPAYNDFGTI
jgi:hypothetical protein